MVSDTESGRCRNCNDVIKNTGHIYWFLIPSIAIVFGVVARKGFCDECASKFNVIGILSTLLVIIGSLIGLFIFIGSR